MMSTISPFVLSLLVAVLAPAVIMFAFMIGGKIE